MGKTSTAQGHVRSSLKSSTLSSDARFRDVGVVVALCGYGVVAGLIFAPWQREPFDILDFSEFLLVLQEASSFWERLRGLGTYYAVHGRVSQVAYGFIAANYGFFGLDPLGWQVARCMPMLLLPPVVYLVLRRFGSGRLASLIGASLYVVGTIPTAGWLRLTGEPIGTLFLLGCTGLAHGWSDCHRERWRTFLLAFCLLGMLFSKETMVACLPFLCVVAACWSANNEIQRPRVPSAARQFLGTCIAACAILGVALLWAAASRGADAYASQYGASVLSMRTVATRLGQLTLPVFHYTDLWNLLLFPPNFVFLALFLTGLVSLVLTGPHKSATMRKLLVAASLPASGIMVYLPWPRFEPFHAIPFLLGVAIAFAVLLDASAFKWRARVVVVVCWFSVLAGSAVNAIGLAQFSRARRQLNHEMARQIATYNPADTILIVSANLTSQRWQNPAATLGRYVRAVGLAEQPPILLDVECQTGTVQDWREDGELHVKFVYETPCGAIHSATRAIERSFRFFDWSTGIFQPVVDRVAIIEPQT